MKCTQYGRHKRFLTLSVAALALTCAMPALAQTPKASTATTETVVVTGESEARNLDYVVDTGSRLGLSNREIPAIVDVLTQADLQLQGLDSAIDALNGAPGVVAGNNPGAIGLGSMRGFTCGTNFQYDGVRMSTPGSEFRNWDSWSFERIEVLKGPASVQSGDGALVGTVNFVPKHAVIGETSFDVLASYGTFDSTRLAGGANVSLGDKAAARLDAVTSSTGGWVDDTDSSTLAVNGSVLLEASDRLRLTLAIDHFEDEFRTAYFGTPLVARSIARRPSNAVTGPGDLVLDEAMARVNFNVEDSDVSSDSTWYRARLDYSLPGNWKLRNDLSYFDGFRNWVNTEASTFNAGTNLIDRSTTLITHDQQVLYDRLQLSHDGKIAGRRNRFTVGAEASIQDFASKRRFGAGSSVDPFDPVRGVFPSPDNAANFGTRQQVEADVDSYALFVEDALNITEDLLLVGGLRFDQIELQRSILNVTSGAVTRYGNTYEPLNWRVGAVYNVQPQTQLFAQYSSAVTPVSGLLFISAANSAFDLTTGETYEAGIKTSAFGERLQLTLSAFHIRQDDILTRDPANPALTVQGGSQISDGVEGSLAANLTSELRLEIGAAILNAEFDELIEAGGVDRSGKTPISTPEQLADLVLTWSPEALPLSIFGAVRYTGEHYTTTSNLYRIADVTLLDAGLTWKAPFANITVRGRNLTDEVYGAFGFGSEVQLGEPRSFDVTLSRSF